MENTIDPLKENEEKKKKKIILSQSLANQLPDACIDLKRVTKSYIRVANAPIKVDVVVGQTNITNESQPHMKHGRLVGSIYKNHRTRK